MREIDIITYKSRKLVVISLILVFLFIGSVSADDSFSNLQKVVDNTNNDDVVYLNNTYYSADKENNPIVIDKNITINGASKTNKEISTIDGKNITGLFSIIGDKKVNFINIKFINGKATKGSAISNKVTNYTINDGSCWPTTFFQHCNVYVYNSSFINNYALDVGGAIDVYSLTTYNTIFSNNYAENNGGAIFAYRSVCYNTTFEKNIAKNDGGAIYGEYMCLSDMPINSAILFPCNCGNTITRSYSQVNSFNCKFINNKAGNGSAINAYEVSIVNSSFLSNNAQNGAVWVYFYLNVTNSEFKDNFASNCGAAICTHVNYNNIENSTFTNNFADNGGAIYACCILDIKNSNFNKNTAKINGGAIFAHNDVNIINSNFIENNATYGSAIYQFNAFNQFIYFGVIEPIVPDIFINNSNFKSNIANKNGGAIHSTVYHSENFIVGLPWISLNNSNFTDNGLAIYMDGFNITTKNCIFDDENPVFNNDYVSTLDGLRFYYYKNLLYSFKGTEFYLKGESLSSEIPNIFVKVTINGYEKYTFLNIDGTVKIPINLKPGKYNFTIEYDGLNYKPFKYDSDFTIIYSKLANLQAIIDSSKDNSIIYLNNTYFELNKTDYKTVNINKNIIIHGGFENDTSKFSTFDGVGIFGTFFKVNKNATATFINIHFINGVSPTDEGGAIYSDGDVKIINSTFKNNVADCGGAIYSNGLLSIIHSTFINNTANYGGAIYAKSTKISNSIFKDNVGKYNEKVGYTDGELLFGTDNSVLGTIVGPQFKPIIAGVPFGFGGAIYNLANLTIKETKFINNSANYQAGAIKCLGKDIVEITNSIFTGNHATYGGAIFASNTIDFNIFKSTFEENKANFGGAIHFSKVVESIVEECIFNRNTAEIGGAVHYIDSKNCVINNSIFTANTAGKLGSAIKYEDNSSSCAVLNSIFKSNIVKNKIVKYTIQYLCFDKLYIPMVDLVVSSLPNDCYVDYSNFNYNKTGDNFDAIHINTKEGNIFYLKNNTMGQSTLPIFLEKGVIDGLTLTFNNNTVNIGKEIILSGFLSDVNGNRVGLYDDLKIIINNITIGAHFIMANGQYEAKFSSNITGEYLISGITNINLNINKGILKVIDSSSIKIVAYDIVKFFKNGTVYSATFYNKDGSLLKNTAVKFYINGQYYTRKTNNQGLASLAINLGVGKYVITAEYGGYNVSNQITVLSLFNQCNDIVKYFRNSTQYTVKVLDNQGKTLKGANVSFNINGVLYYRTSNNDGIAKLNINLGPGKYVITAEYNGCKVSNNISVLPTIVNNENITKFYRGLEKYSVKVLDKQGSPLSNVSVVFNINGVLYNRNTNSDGVASLNINLGSGKYTITAMYDEMTVSNVITVLSVIQSSDIEMTKNNRIPFASKLLDKEGKPFSNVKVSYNVNGIIYNRITDSNGDSKLNINLAPGKYIITAMYEGLCQSNTIVVKE